MKRQMTAYVYWQTNEYHADGGHPELYSSPGMEKFGNGLSPLAEVAIEFDVPDDFDSRAKLIDGLLAEKQKLIAETTKSVEAINEKVQKLLAISHEVEA